jgi:chromosome segregation ATPase
MQIALLSVMALGLVSAESEKVTPVQKVIQLLDGMIEKGTKEKQDEEIQFTKFKGFCESTTKFKREAIEDNNEQITSLQADIQKFEADAELLTKEIAQIDIDLTTWKGDQKASNKVRDIERAEYEKVHKEYTEAIDALDEAIATLMKQAGDVAQEAAEAGAAEQVEAAAAEALVQVSNSKLVPDRARKAIAAFLQIQPGASLKDAMEFGEMANAAHEQLAKESLIQTSDEVGAPEANAYEFQAQGVVDMMDKLVKRFTKERSELEDTEMAARRAYQMVQGDLKNQIDGSEGVNEEKKKAKAKSLQSAAGAKGDLADCTGTLAEDEKYLADLIATCEQKAVAFESRQKLRAEELEAVEKAKEIMAGGAVSGGADKHLPAAALVQATSLVQLRGESQNPNQMKVVSFLKAKSEQLKSRLLAVLSTRVAADPFKKVKKMVKDLIVKLMQEANDEAEHKGFCDMEMATNKNTRDKKSEDVINLTAEIDELKASIAKISQDIEGLSGEIAELDAAVAKATSERDEEKAKNTVTIKDAQEAQAAVKAALGVLQEFYDKAATATALAQEQTKQEPPATFDEPYTGMGGESGGVVGMMEVIQADFARLESETSTAEGEAAKEYSEFIDDSRVSKTNKSADLDHKQEKKNDQSQALASAEKELAGTQKELDSANEYFEKLKPQCLAPVESFEDRQARRKEEIESLQMALQILQGEDVVF